MHVDVMSMYEQNFHFIKIQVSVSNIITNKLLTKNIKINGYSIQITHASTNSSSKIGN
jgi:hypothetical protein